MVEEELEEAVRAGWIPCLDWSCQDYGFLTDFSLFYFCLTHFTFVNFS